jgi:hypothetical protein
LPTVEATASSRHTSVSSKDLNGRRCVVELKERCPDGSR